MTPDGKAETLWELCEQVCESIAAQPANYFQHSWAIKAESARNMALSCNRDPERKKQIEHTEVCGTAYCRAGWMMAHLRGKAVTYNEGDQAMDLLRAARIECGTLFSSEEAGPLAEWGTPEYVQRGVDGMRKFMEANEAKLRAFQITDEMRDSDWSPGPSSNGE